MDLFIDLINIHRISGAVETLPSNLCDSWKIFIFLWVFITACWTHQVKEVNKLSYSENTKILLNKRSSIERQLVLWQLRARSLSYQRNRYRHNVQYLKYFLYSWHSKLEPVWLSPFGQTTSNIARYSVVQVYECMCCWHYHGMMGLVI